MKEGCGEYHNKIQREAQKKLEAVLIKVRDIGATKFELYKKSGVSRSAINRYLPSMIRHRKVIRKGKRFFWREIYERYHVWVSLMERMEKAYIKLGLDPRQQIAERIYMFVPVTVGKDIIVNLFAPRKRDPEEMRIMIGYIKKQGWIR